MDINEVHHGGERRAGHVGGFQGEIPLRVFPRQREVCQGSRIPLVDVGKEVGDRIR